MNLWN